MPAQPAWFHRLDEILALLRGFDTRYLDRQAGREAVERYARGGRRGSPGARGPGQGRSGLRPLGPVCAAAPAHERVGRLSERRGREGALRGWPYASCSRLLLIQVLLEPGEDLPNLLRPAKV